MTTLIEESRGPVVSECLSDAQGTMPVRWKQKINLFVVTTRLLGIYRLSLERSDARQGPVSPEETQRRKDVRAAIRELERVRAQ
jgi:hypothetical protein